MHFSYHPWGESSRIYCAPTAENRDFFRKNEKNG